MGLDVTLLDAGSKMVGRLEISEGLHGAIFGPDKAWASYSQLRKMEDYYTGRVVYRPNDLALLRDELERYGMLIPAAHRREYDALQKALAAPEVEKIFVDGD